MMRSMFAAISGLKVHQTMLDVTSNDIANVNTLGYKGQRTTFKDSLAQLQRGGFRCPYCGSTDTALENLFGPTPCRSLRYCRGCRQPFEQFKTI